MSEKPLSMKILHLSDLHIKDQNISQDIVLNSLKRKLTELFQREEKPDILILTGDIAYQGKTEEYEKAKDFINYICEQANIPANRVFLIPGNHDVDRSKIEKHHLKWYYKFENETDLNDNLSVPACHGALLDKISAYQEFASTYHTGKNLSGGKYGEYVFEINNDEFPQSIKIKIVGLNTTLFCGYDGDEKEKLAIGLDQVNYCENQLDPEIEIIITCLHHPFKCYHPCEKPTLKSVLRISDIVLSGHEHDSDCFSRRGQHETVFISAGAVFEDRQKENGFNTIELDLQTLHGKAYSYKYSHQNNTWIINKDFSVESDGRFPFSIPSKKINLPPSQAENKTSTHSLHRTKSVQGKIYVATLNSTYSDLTRAKFESIVTHLKTVIEDSNLTINKLEPGSVTIYFTSEKHLPASIINDLNKSGEFEFSKFQPVQRDQKPREATASDKEVNNWKAKLSKQFWEKIKNPGARFTHSRVDNLLLNDLYISPNLKKINISSEKERMETIVNATVALNKKPGIPLKIVIYGPDNSGKSTLIRWNYNKLYQAGYIPVLLLGEDIKHINCNRLRGLANFAYSNQYATGKIKSLENFEEDKIVIFIDDFHKIRFQNAKFKSNLIHNLNKTFPNLIITGNDLMQLETYRSNSSCARNSFEDLEAYTILEFGPKLRYELLKKWNGLGRDLLAPNELIRLNNETESHIESIIGRNFVPSYPLYLLTILQAREITSGKKPEYSLHGFYYEVLINDALNKAVKSKPDISLYYNYITDYSFFLFKNNIRQQPLAIQDFETFHSSYCLDYNINISSENIINVLVNSKLLEYRDNYITIPYRYVYYFFIARYLANTIATSDTKEIVKALCERVHRDEFGSIVMFLTHLSKDQFILNQLLENSRNLFKEYKPLKLESEVHFINDMIKNLPEHVYKSIDIEKIKEEELREEEELAAQEKEFDSEKDNISYDLKEDITTLDALSKIVKAVKTIEIIGQLTKKYWGELKGPTKYELAEETYMLGLRTLGFYYSLLEKDTDLLVGYLTQIYWKKHLNRTMSKDQVDKASRNFLFGLCVMAAFGITKRITNAIGYDKLTGTFEDILKSHPYNSTKLIDTSIRLEHNKSFPWDQIQQLKELTEKHLLAKSILKNLVIHYLYIFYTSEKDKQRICELLEIKIDQQRVIDAVSVVKK